MVTCRVFGTKPSQKCYFKSNSYDFRWKIEPNFFSQKCFLKYPPCIPCHQAVRNILSLQQNCLMEWIYTCCLHYSDVTMGGMASQITSLTIVYSTVNAGTDQRKHQSSASLAFCAGNSPVTDEFPAQRARNAENVSIWWCHHMVKGSSTTTIQFVEQNFI